MSRPKSRSRFTLAAVVIIAGAGLLAAENPPASDLGELQDLYRARDFFSLAERLEGISDAAAETPEIRFLIAATQQAFNQPGESNRTLDSLLEEQVGPSSTTSELLQLQMTNHFRLHRYKDAFTSAQAILGGPVDQFDPALVAEVRGTLPLYAALVDVPPQETEIKGMSRLTLDTFDRLPLKIEGANRRFAFDTGANLSVIMRSEAEELGLTIRPAGVEVATSTTKRVLADIAVAGDVRIGRVHYRNVAFLVFPDEHLTFSDGERISGLIGFPVVEAMQEVRFRRDGVIEIPDRPQTRRWRNLALDNLDPLVRVRYRKDDLVCRLDTGASHTTFFQPFYERYRERIESNGKHRTAKVGGVGGVQEMPAFRLNKIGLSIAGAGGTLRDVDVFTRSIRPPHENYLYCNVGQDIFQSFRAHVINFRDMALVLE
jgi:hypothetical protein